MTASPTRRIAILASSGGNLRSHGGDDPAKLILDAKRQIEAAGFELVLTQFVAAGASMDTADDRTPRSCGRSRTGSRRCLRRARWRR